MNTKKSLAYLRRALSHPDPAIRHSAALAVLQATAQTTAQQSKAA